MVHACVAMMNFHMESAHKKQPLAWTFAAICDAFGSSPFTVTKPVEPGS